MSESTELGGSTELEGCVLGIVWQHAPCTAYAVRKVFLDSPSAYWSGSAGAIYPLVERLVERGLLDSRPVGRGSRVKRELSLTDLGVEALRRWIGPPLPASAGAATFDPIRTRLFFLEALRGGDRQRLLDEAERLTREELDRLRSFVDRLRAQGERQELLASRGGVHELEARLAWLAEVRAELGG